MHVLIWSPAWPTQGGDLFFGLNAFTKTLLVQAETLISQNCKVTVAFPDAFKEYVRHLNGRCELISVPVREATETLQGWNDPSSTFYANGMASRTSEAMAAFLRPQLPDSVDVVLLWETPVPYLREIYPDALIVNQMPGAFARAPYPPTVTFDPCGLYRQGAMYAYSNEILSEKTVVSPLITSFRNAAREIFYRFPIPSAAQFKFLEKDFALLPLQISDHYAFKTDTGFSSQAEFCLKALEEFDPAMPVFVTQYISRMYKDAVMTPEFAGYVQERYPNLVFDRTISAIPSVSQHLLQDASELAVATSGLGLQAMIWDIPLRVIGDTHLRPYDRSFVNTHTMRQRAMTFALTKNQPLASKLSDGRFLVSLLEEMRYRRSKPFEERFPAFDSIDANYNELVLAGFRMKPVERDFAKAGIGPMPASKDGQFAKILKKQPINLVSFDLFDTLITRGFEAPADLYRLLEIEALRLGLPPVFDFAGKRLAAELAARAAATGDEISLDDIYREFAALAALPIQEVQSYMEAEIDLEIAASRTRPIGRRMYTEAKALGVTVVITSDMYLPRRCIDAILKRSHYEPDQLYLSSEIGLTKKSGALFDHILAERGLDPGSIIHVGDNTKTDVEPARSRGLQTFHVPKSADFLRKHQAIFSALGRRTPMTSPARSAVAAAIAHKLFDDPKRVNLDSISQGNPWVLGYVTLGPLLVGMGTWIRRNAIEMHLDTLHFLSREGKILKDAYDRICLEAPSPARSNYLFGSRRVIRIAQLKNFQDIYELASQTIDKTATVGSFLAGRFSLDLPKIELDQLQAAGYSDLNQPIGNSASDKARLNQLLKAFERDILEIANREGPVYQDYLKANGLTNDEAFAVVDVGWHANMQGSLGQILGKPITGLYFATLDASARWKAAGHTIKGYLGEDFASTDRNGILSNRLMLENLLCDITPTIERVDRTDDGKFIPVFAGRTPASRLSLIEPMQRGALAFVDDICRAIGPNIGSIDFRTDITTPLLLDFLGAPAADDARLFIGAVIEDTFSGAATRYFINPEWEKKSSYWQNGVAALKKAKDASGGRTGKPSQNSEAKPSVVGAKPKSSKAAVKPKPAESASELKPGTATGSKSNVALGNIEKPVKVAKKANAAPTLTNKSARKSNPLKGPKTVSLMRPKPMHHTSLIWRLYRRFKRKIGI